MIPTKPGYYWARGVGSGTWTNEFIVQVLPGSHGFELRVHDAFHSVWSGRPKDYHFLSGPLPKPGPSEDATPGPEDASASDARPTGGKETRAMTPTEPGYYWAIRSYDKTSEPERFIVRVERADSSPTPYLEVQIGKSTYPLDHFRFLSGPLVPPPLTPDGEKAGSPPDPTRENDQARQLAALLGRTEAIIARSEALADRAQGMEGDDLAARVRHLETSRQAFRAVNESLNRRIDALEAKAVRDMNDAISRQGDMEGWEEKFASMDGRLAVVEESREAQDDINANISGWLETLEAKNEKFTSMDERLRVLEEVRKTQDDINAMVRDRLEGVAERFKQLNEYLIGVGNRIDIMDGMK